MKRIILYLMVASFPIVLISCAVGEEKAGSYASPTATATVMAVADAEKEVLMIHQEYDNAWVNQDAAVFDRLLADDYTVTDHDGKVITRAEVLADAKSGDRRYDAGKSEGVKVRVYDNTALVTGRWVSKSSYKGEPFEGTTQYTTVYVKKDGRWQAVSDQVTLIPPQKPAG